MFLKDNQNDWNCHRTPSFPVFAIHVPPNGTFHSWQKKKINGKDQSSNLPQQHVKTLSPKKNTTNA